MNPPASQRPHPSLLAGLAATLLATAWALWWPDDAATDRGTSPSSTQATGDESGVAKPRPPSVTASAAVTTATEDPPLLSAASRDPFFPAPPPAPAAPAKATPTEPSRAEPSPPPAPAPAPPPMNHRILGRFQSPEGQWLVFLQDGAQTVVAAPGVTLSSGYAVESVTAKEVRLRHPLAEQPVSLPLPEDNAP